MTLDEVADIQSGFAFASKEYSETGHFLVRIGNVQDGQISLDNPRFVELEKRTKKFELQPGDFLTSLTGNIGRVARINETHLPAALNQRVARLRITSKQALPDYVGYFLQSDSFGERLRQKSHGAAQANVSPKEIASIPVALPFLDEQKRIVAVFDQAFAALDRARAHAEANLADAIELKNCCVESELSSNVLGELESVGPHVNLLTGFAFKSGGYTEDPEDIRLVRGDNIVQGEFRWDGVKRWPVSDRANYEKYELARDDVLIAMDRTWISAGIKYAIVDEAALPSLLVQRVARLRSKPSLLPRYLAYWIGSKFFERYVLFIQTGLGVPHVSGSQIENFSIRVPSISEQEAVLDRLDKIMERRDRLVSAYRRKVTDLANLRQSLLQKAFSGQLA